MDCLRASYEVENNSRTPFEPWKTKMATNPQKTVTNYISVLKTEKLINFILFSNYNFITILLFSSKMLQNSFKNRLIESWWI